MNGFQSTEGSIADIFNELIQRDSFAMGIIYRENH